MKKNISDSRFTKTTVSDSGTRGQEVVQCEMAMHEAINKAGVRPRRYALASEVGETVE